MVSPVRLRLFEITSGGVELLIEVDELTGEILRIFVDGKEGSGQNNLTNAVDYGLEPAPADGTAALAAADAAAVAAGRTLYIPPGDYNVDSDLTLNAPLDLAGTLLPGPGATLTIEAPPFVAYGKVFGVDRGGSFAFGRRGGQQFDVRWFGAVGDGATDDTAALQAAIDGASGQDVQVVVPAGTFNHTGLTVSSDVRIVGLPTFRPAPGRSARLVCTAPAPNIHVDLSSNGAQVEIGHLVLIGGSYGILFDGGNTLLRGSRFHDLIIDGASQAGLFLDGTSGTWEAISTVWQNIFIDGVFGQPGYGIRVTVQTGAAILTGSLWKNIRVGRTTQWAISLDSSNASYRDFGTWEGLIIEENDGGGIQIRSGSADIRGCHFEVNGVVTDRPDIQLEHSDAGIAVDCRLLIGTMKFNSGGASQTSRLVTVDDSAMIVTGYDGNPGASWDFANTNTYLQAHWTRRRPNLLNAGNLRGFEVDAANGQIVQFP